MIPPVGSIRSPPAALSRRGTSVSQNRIYSEAMKRRTTIVIDDDLVGQAREVLGTKGLKETIEAALDEVVKTALRRRLMERLRTGRGLDLGPEILAEIRRPPPT